MIIFLPIMHEHWIFELPWPHNFIIFIINFVPVESDKNFGYIHENILIDYVYSIIFQILIMETLIYWTKCYIR